MLKARLSVFAVVLALGAAGAGCKKDSDTALVVFTVQVDTSLRTSPATIAELDFSIPGAASKRVLDHDDGNTFTFGYYVTGVTGNVVVTGKALNAAGCVIGQGTLAVNGVTPGQTVTAPSAPPLLIAKLTMPVCGTDAGTDGGKHDGSTKSDAGPKDAEGADRPDGGHQDAGGGGDGPKVGLGSQCAGGGDCASGFCVDGVCCESACTGSCEACAELNMKGMCVAVTGTPRTGHTACTGTGPCAGTCDGASRSVCTNPGTTQPCGAASCTNGVATLTAMCDGAGACATAQTVTCAPNTCSGTICAGGCADNTGCTGTTYCSAGKCVAKKANGQTCAAAAECTSGACADGYCCNSACTGSCMACNVSGSPGTCSAVKAAVDDTCSSTQICDASGACKKANGQTCTATTDCASGACVDGHCCGSAACGTCQACTGGGGTCVAVTSADDDTCTGANTCDTTGACKAKAGQACTAGTQCVTGFCADGVCCNSACTGACEACAESTGKGTCTAVSGTPRSGHTACVGAGSTCGGACDGTNRTACTYPNTATSCRAASCTSGTATLAASCDGAGNCPALQTVMCAPNTCAGTVCAGGCSSSQPCSGNNYCAGGTCVPKKANGTACGSAAECTNGACVDGFCCGSASCGACQACTGSGGTCVAITNADDPDSCTGTSSCDATGTCKKKTGQTCTAATQCVSGNCADGVCCNTACNGSCEYCNGGSPGTCGLITGSPRSGHTACAGTGACLGTCNGAKSTCSLPGAETTCRQPSCSGTQATNSAVCDGAGNCPSATFTPCSPFTCGSTSCLGSCTTSTQCVSGAACVGGTCKTCPSGQIVCGNACVDPTSDASNCGACNHGCYGGTCAGSLCQPVQVATDSALDGLDGIAVGSGRVYVSSWQTVGSCSGTVIGYMAENAPSGTALTQLSAIPETCYNFVVDPVSSDLLMNCASLAAGSCATSGESHVRRVSWSAGGVGSIVVSDHGDQMGGTGPLAGAALVFAGGGNVYWDDPFVTDAVDLSSTAIGSTYSIFKAVPSGDSFTILASDNSSLFGRYYLSSASQYVPRQLDFATGNWTSLSAGSASAAAAMASDNSNVFYVISGTGVYATPKGTTSPTLIVSDSTVNFVGGADGTNVYYSTIDAVSGATCPGYKISKVGKGGGTTSDLLHVSGLCVTDIKGDSNIVAWQLRTPGCASGCMHAVYKVAK